MSVYYTVRLIIQVRSTRRQIKEFIRREHVANTSSYAQRFESIEAAEVAALQVADCFIENGHTYIGHDVFEVHGHV